MIHFSLHPPAGSNQDTTKDIPFSEAQEDSKDRRADFADLVFTAPPPPAEKKIKTPLQIDAPASAWVDGPPLRAESPMQTEVSDQGPNMARSARGEVTSQFSMHDRTRPHKRMSVASPLLRAVANITNAPSDTLTQHAAVSDRGQTLEQTVSGSAGPATVTTAPTSQGIKPDQTNEAATPKITNTNPDPDNPGSARALSETAIHPSETLQSNRPPSKGEVALEADRTAKQEQERPNKTRPVVSETLGHTSVERTDPLRPTQPEQKIGEVELVLAQMDRSGITSVSSLSSLDKSDSALFLAPSLGASPSPLSSPVLSAPSLANSAQIPAMAPSAITRVVSEKLVNSPDTQDRIVIQLDPPELGRVAIDFKFDAQGVPAVTITSESPEALKQLRLMHFELVQALEQNGLSGRDLTFSQGNPGEAQHGPEQVNANPQEDETIVPSSNDPVSLQSQDQLNKNSGLDLKL